MSEPGPIDSPAQSVFDDVEEFRMPLMEHLRELRQRLIVSLVASAFGVAACMGFADAIWEFLARPMNEALVAHDGTMAQLDPLEGFMNYLKVSVVAGMLLVSPILSWQTWKFIAPGLYKNEKKTLIPIVLCSTILFLGGAAFGYSVIFKFAFPFFLEVTPDGVEAVISINSYLSVATKLLMAFGLAFQLPIVVFFLARLGLINHRDMIVGFKFSVVGMFVAAAMLTPPDVLSQVLMVGPLIGLYGLGIIIAWMVSTKPVEEPE